MKRFTSLLISFVFIMSAAVFASSNQDSAAAGIKFEHGNWADITARAKKENKIIFLDAFASWCGPCKWMAKNVFTDAKVGDLFNEKFVCAKIDMEKGEGNDLRKKFGVTAFPTFLYISPDGETIIHRTCGSTPAETFIQNGLNALNPEKQLNTIKKKFEANPSDAKLAYTYLELMQAACADADREVESYFKTQKPSDLNSADNWKIIFTFVNDPNSEVFKYVLKNKKDFETSAPAALINKKIEGVFETGLQKIIRKGDVQSYEAMKTTVRNAGIENAEKIILNADMLKFQKGKDWNNYASSAEKFINAYAKDDPQVLNSAAWTFYENITDKALLEKAAGWAARAAQIADNYAVNDTYAAVLYKLGKKNEARDVARKAIELAKKESADYKETEELLAKIEKLK